MNSAMLTIFNRSLSAIGQPPLASLDEDTVARRYCLTFYPQERDELLSLHPWSFAQRRVLLQRLASNPLFGFDYAYALPHDFLVLHLPRTKRTAFVIENDKFLCNLEEVEMVYTARVEDISRFSPSFKGALIFRLAVALATPTLCDVATRDRAAQLSEIKLFEAITQDVKQHVDNEFFSERWVDAR